MSFWDALNPVKWGESLAGGLGLTSEEAAAANPELIKQLQGQVSRPGALQFVDPADDARAQQLQAQLEDAKAKNNGRLDMPEVQAVQAQIDALNASAEKTNPFMTDTKPSDYWQGQMDTARGLNPEEVQAARSNYGDVRGQQLQGGQGFLDIAEGRAPSIAQQIAAQERDRGRAQVMSQLASQRGSYNPAAQRAAMMAIGRQGAAIGSNAAIAGEQERRAARQAYLGNLGNVGKQDLSQLGSEQGFALGRENVAKGYGQLGSQASQYDSGARQGLQSMLQDRDLQIMRAGLGLEEAAKAREAQGQKQFIGALAGGAQAAMGKPGG